MAVGGGWWTEEPGDGEGSIFFHLRRGLMGGGRVEEVGVGQSGKTLSKKKHLTFDLNCEG